MLKVWIVGIINRYGSDHITGVYLTEKAAKEAHPGNWEYYNVTGTTQSNGDLRLHCVKVYRKGANPLQKLALDILNGDPMALDAARDILKC